MSDLITMPSVHALIATTLDALQPRAVAEWLRDMRRACVCCEAEGEHQRLLAFRTAPPVPTPHVVCDACCDRLIALSWESDIELAVRYLVERRRSPGRLATSFETMCAAGLRLGRGQEPFSYRRGSDEEALLLALVERRL